mmetsp:Transcript_5275/g.11976  ORF Transcript_5275/g.11976 Transcript_5275/m.11976 type:complete len:93 (-) Transcript_5275:311-589(-)
MTTHNYMGVSSTFCWRFTALGHSALSSCFQSRGDKLPYEGCKFKRKDCVWSYWGESTCKRDGRQIKDTRKRSCNSGTEERVNMMSLPIRMKE